MAINAIRCAQNGNKKRACLWIPTQHENLTQNLKSGLWSWKPNNFGWLELELAPKMLDGGAESEIWVPVPQPWFVGQASCTNKYNAFQSSIDQIISVPEPKASYAWSWSHIRSLEFEFKLHSPAWSKSTFKSYIFIRCLDARNWRLLCENLEWRSLKLLSTPERQRVKFCCSSVTTAQVNLFIPWSGPIRLPGRPWPPGGRTGACCTRDPLGCRNRSLSSIVANRRWWGHWWRKHGEVSACIHGTLTLKQAKSDFPMFSSNAHNQK